MGDLYTMYTNVLSLNEMGVLSIKKLMLEI